MSDFYNRKNLKADKINDQIGIEMRKRKGGNKVGTMHQRMEIKSTVFIKCVASLSNQTQNTFCQN